MHRSLDHRCGNQAAGLEHAEDRLAAAALELEYDSKQPGQPARARGGLTRLGHERVDQWIVDESAAQHPGSVAVVLGKDQCDARP